MYKEDELLNFALSKYAKYIGMSSSKEYVAEDLVAEFGVSMNKAMAVSEAAFKEWVEAYTG